MAGDTARGEGADGRLGEFSADAKAAVLDYTGLTPCEPIPEAEWVDRPAWLRINLEGFRAAAGLVEARIGERLRLPGRLASVGPAAIGKIAAVEVGALLGYSSRRVLGQYEYPILGDPAKPRAPRLLFVAPNIAAARGELGADPEALLRWIALHEVTHAVHFAAAPWLRAHIGGLARELIGSAEVGPRPGDVAAAMRRVVSEDPRKLVEELRSSDPMTLLAPASVRPLIAEIQASMAMIEGYAEHVMDAAAGGIGGDVAALRIAIDRRRADKGPLARLLAWLLGMELKMRQYRDGKQFVDAVVADAGIETLNRAWENAEMLPVGGELATPERWVERVVSAPTRA